MATRSRYRSFTAKEKLRIIKESENIGNRSAGKKSMMCEKVIYVTGAKNKLRLTEKNSRPNRWTFCRKKEWHHELEKKTMRLHGR